MTDTTNKVGNVEGTQARLVAQLWALNAAHDWEAGASLAAHCRALFPDDTNGYVVGITALRHLKRVEEAEALAADAERRFPALSWPLSERAQIRIARGDLEGGLELCARLRAEFPEQASGYTVASASLRAAGRHQDALEILRPAAERFSQLAWWLSEQGWAFFGSGDWTLALERGEQLVGARPDSCEGARLKALALEKLGRLDDAEAVLAEAEARYPDDRDVVAHHAWLASVRADWKAAVERSERLRQRFPTVALGFTVGAHGLSRLGRIPEATALVEEAIRRFPDSAWPLNEGAYSAFRRGDFAATIEYARALNARFPAHGSVHLLGSSACLQLGDLPGAEAFLQSGIDRFPAEPAAYIEFARVAHRRAEHTRADARWAHAYETFPDHREIGLEHAQSLSRKYNPTDSDWTEVFARLQKLHDRFPDFEPAYEAHLALRNRARQHAEAERLGVAAAQRFPHNAAVQLAIVLSLNERRCTPEAIDRLAAMRYRFPEDPMVRNILTDTLAKAGRITEAQEVSTAALQKFPDDATVHLANAEVAALAHDWDEAASRLEKARARFPTDARVRARLAEIRVATASDEAVEPSPATLIPREGSAVPDAITNLAALAVAFQGLGGTAQGCEFGIVQRLMGAEPLGLLRWANITVDNLTKALNARFAGLGDPPQTEVFYMGPDHDAEYALKDRLYDIVIHTFIKKAAMPYQKMYDQMCRRMAFLARKLIEDLTEPRMTFVYKMGTREASDEEIAQLHQAIRGFGDNRLLYVRKGTERSPPGTVQVIAPGLLHGYIEHYSLADNGEPRPPDMKSWTAIMKRASELVP